MKNVFIVQLLFTTVTQSLKLNFKKPGQQEDVFQYKDPSVVAINKNNFELLLQKYNFIFNYVFSSKDIYSKSQLEDYERFAYKQMHSRWNYTNQGIIIKFARLEYEHNITAAKKLGVKAIPEMQVIRDEKVVCRGYQKKVTLKKMKKFINKCYFDLIFVHLKVQVEQILSISKLSIIFYGENSHRNARSLAFWTMTHYKDRKGIMFYLVTDKKIGEKFGLEWNSTSLYRQADKKIVPYKLPFFSHRMLKEWIWVNSFPPVVWLNETHYDRFIKYLHPIFVLYIDGTRSMKSIDAIIEFERAGPHLQESKYLGMIVDIRSDLGQKFGMKMEFHPSEGVPYVICYYPHQHHNDEGIHHYRMKTQITDKNVIEFANLYKMHKVKHEHKHEKSHEISSEHLIQKISRNNFKSKMFTLQKKNYDIIVLFYHSKDWKNHHSQKAYKEFKHAAHVLGKRIDHLQSSEGSETKDFSIRLFTFDQSKNTRNGLKLKAEKAPIIRMYRIHDTKYFIDHAYEADHPKDIIHFIYDQATHDLQLDDHIEETNFDNMDDVEMDM